MMDVIKEISLSFNYAVALVIILFAYFGHQKFGLFITWRCGLCGKLNETNLIKFVLGWCDHLGDT